MEKKWTYRAVCSIIQIHFVRGVWEGNFNAEDIYALPGSDVNLTCRTQKKGFLVQMQWSKEVDLIALYNLQYGFHCPSGVPCKSLVTFTEVPGNMTEWTLHLRNVSSSLSGKYECKFILFPEGIQMKSYNLLIQKNVTLDEWRSNNIIEIEINRTLEIPCFQNVTSEISSVFSFAWLAEDNETQETLITQGHSISNSTVFKDRITLGADYALSLSPVQIHDNDRKFSCHLTTRSNRTLKSSTMVKVFAKPEIPMIMEINSTDVLAERTFTCSMRNVFPTANLTWLIDRNFPQGEREEIYIPNEVSKDESGFLNVTSVFSPAYDNKVAQSNTLTIWCMTLMPAPGNKVWNISSKRITFSLGPVNPPPEPTPSVTESILDTQPSPANGMSSTRYPATSSEGLADMRASTPNSRPPASRSSVTTQVFSYSWTPSRKDTKASAPWIPSETYSSSPSGAGPMLHGANLTSTSKASSEVPTTANGSTRNNSIFISSIVVNKPKDGMSWPVIVAALLFSCLFLFGLGVRKWCQYQQEIMERPPSFKPPPPPIKYTCIQEPVGSDLPCHEMETL